MTTLHQSDLRPCLDCDASRRACRIALSAALLAALVACRAPSPRAAPPDRAPPPPATHEPGDASYDCHGLLIAPFGSVLKDIPLALHEVLLFRDDAHGSDRHRAIVRGGSKCRCLRGPRRRHSLPRPARGGAGSGGHASSGIGLVDYLRQRSQSLSNPPVTRESELELLAAGARDIGIALDSSGAEALLKLVDELELGNAQFNLTAIRDRLGMLRKHALDSLSLHPYLPGTPPPPIPTAAGFPIPPPP